MADKKNLRGHVLVVGMSPLLVDAMPEDTVFDVLVLGKRPPADKESSREVRAAKTLYRGAADGNFPGEPVIPAANVLACLREAGRRVPYQGRSNISTAGTSRLFDLMSIDADEIRLCLPNGTPCSADVKDGHWVPDLRRGMMKGKGGNTACGIVRAKFPRWALSIPVTLTLEGHPVTEQGMRQLFAVAGAQIGLCSFNPIHNGPFGRFSLAAWSLKSFQVETATVATMLPKTFQAAASK